MARATRLPEGAANGGAVQAVHESFKGHSQKVLLGNNGIATRHLAFDAPNEAFESIPYVLIDRFTRLAPVLVTRSATEVLAEANVRAEEIVVVLISTCTGYLCPGLTSHARAARLVPGCYANRSPAELSP